MGRIIQRDRSIIPACDVELNKFEQIVQQTHDIDYVGGTKIPDTADFFMQQLSKAGFNAVILFPLAGIVTEKTCVLSAQQHGLGVIVGGMMTHKGFLRSDNGWISDDKVVDIYYL